LNDVGNSNRRDGTGHTKRAAKISAKNRKITNTLG
jgi:hypothetical protein